MKARMFASRIRVSLGAVMMLLLLLELLLDTVNSAPETLPYEELSDANWEAFKEKYNKTYDGTKEEYLR